jgi:hypothetical protein
MAAFSFLTVAPGHPPMILMNFGVQLPSTAPPRTRRDLGVLSGYVFCDCIIAAAGCVSAPRLNPYVPAHPDEFRRSTSEQGSSANSA